MPKPTKGPRLGGSPAHQRLILRNLATQLFEHGAITTTEKKARVLRPFAEKLITKAKKGDLHNRRLVLRELFNGVDQAALEEGVLVVNKYPQHKLFTEIAPMYANRPGGYTRITKIGPRKGDNAPMAVISLVTEAYTPSASSSSTKKETAVSSSADETPAPVPATDEPELVDEGAREEESGAGDTTADADSDGTDAVVEEASSEAEPAAGTDDPEAQAAAEDAAPTEGDKNA